MTTFLRLLSDRDKQAALLSAVRAGGERVFEVDPASFCQIPGAPFAYWVSESVRNIFAQLPPFEVEGRTARAGLQTSDDFRFVRAKWEIQYPHENWASLAKGGAHSPFYADIYLAVKWANAGREISNFSSLKTGKVISYVRNAELYFRPGLFQTLRAASLAPHLSPPGCIFGDNGSQAFCDKDSLLTTLSLLNSSAADTLHKLLLGRAGYALYRNGTLSRLPVPKLSDPDNSTLAALGLAAWKLRRSLDTVEETSHAFLLPEALQSRLGSGQRSTIYEEFERIKSKINAIAYRAYGFTDVDSKAAQDLSGDADIEEEEEGEDNDYPNDEVFSSTDTLCSWAVGVAFGRFDWRLATGERRPPAEPDPFDPLPAKSPGMLPDGTESFYPLAAGILVDDPGHPHDLTHLVEEVLERVKAPVPNDVRRWLQRDFFTFHLQRYSKSRRKAPIYWPLSTATGSYTLWLYYPSLSSQTLYSAINDFVDGPNGKLKQVSEKATALRNKGLARTRVEETQFEELQAFELELIELRDTLLTIAQNYHPSLDDGVQISAAPLWPLSRHKPWRKVLKDTWVKLEKGDYDWAHLALNYWPGRVRVKCKTDKSLAIAHELEELYIEPEAKQKKTRNKKNTGASE